MSHVSLEESVPCEPGVASIPRIHLQVSLEVTPCGACGRVEWERLSKTACGVTLFGLYKSFCQVSRAQMARLAQGQATLALFLCKSSRRKTWACNTWSNPPCTPHMHLVGSPSGTTRGDRLCAWSTPFATIIVCECAHRTSLRSHDTPRPEVLLTTHQYSMHTHTHTHPRVRTTFFNSLLWAWPLVLWPSDMCAASAVCISLLIAPPVLDVHKQLSRTALTLFLLHKRQLIHCVVVSSG